MPKQRTRYPFLEREGLLAMAHRGGGGLWPQNTMYAFERAVALGMDVLETDVQASSDGALVLIHDETLEATMNGSGRVKDHSLSELKSLDAGYRWSADGGQTFPYRGQGITIPTLEEVITHFPEMRLNIDIKPVEPEVVGLFGRALEKHGVLGQVMVGSFHDTQLGEFRRRYPQVPTAAGVRETRAFYLLSRIRMGRFFRSPAAAFQVPEYAENIHLVTERFIRSAHRRKIEVHVWTVDEVADMRRLMEWGVDGLITDYPDRLLSLLGR